MCLLLVDVIDVNLDVEEIGIKLFVEKIGIKSYINCIFISSSPALRVNFSPQPL